MNLKKQFEKYLKKVVSLRTWYRVKALMIKNNLPVTKNNLQVMATLKIESSRKKISLENSLNYYIESANIDTSLTGKELFAYIKLVTKNKPHRITITRWFSNGYNPVKIYNSGEISKILLNAFIYNLRTEYYATHKKSNRKCAISVEKIRS
jgi:hypothetical protein